MIHLISDDVRRHPYPLYEQMRRTTPLSHDPSTGLWMIFDYQGVHRALSDHENFSSHHGPDWIVFTDPPRHTKLRALISKAFTPRSIANLESRIRQLSRHLLDPQIQRGQMDLAADFAVPLPMMVIAEMLGIPPEDLPRFKFWNDAIIRMSYTIGQRNAQAASATTDFVAITSQMSDYLTRFLEQHRATPGDNLLTRLAAAEIDGDRLTHQEMLGFFQGLLVAGSETTTNLINNAVLCLIENPHEFARLRQNLNLLPSAIEEVLRYRSPLQWMYRLTRRDIPMHGQIIPAGKLVLAIIGSANHDPAQFPDPARFDITRDPNPHIAFGHGVHFCMGAPLARLEAKIALTELLTRTDDLRLATTTPWEPRKGLHVHGPTSLPIRFNQRNSNVPD